MPGRLLRGDAPVPAGAGGSFRPPPARLCPFALQSRGQQQEEGREGKEWEWEKEEGEGEEGALRIRLCARPHPAARAQALRPRIGRGS